ncbi:MAG: DUF4981 domain-containing protein [Bacteroidales bacterium]
MKFKGIDLKDGVIEIENKFDFLNLKEFHFEWIIKSDGKTIHKSEISIIDLQPHLTKIIFLDLPEIIPQRNTEYFLIMKMLPKNGNHFLPDDHIIAWEQFRLPIYKNGITRNIESLPRIQLKETDSILEVFGNDFNLLFNKKSGYLTSFLFEGKELINKGPRLNLWRAPTDNDLGNGMPGRCSMWKNIASEAILKNIDIRNINDFAFRINTTYWHENSNSTFNIAYLVSGDAALKIDAAFSTEGIELPELPRFGIQLILPSEFDSLQWLGRGPHESYWDRKTSASIDLYAGTVWEQYHPYVRPQENGNKTDVRWMGIVQ